MVKRERSPSPSPSFAPSMGSKRSFNSGSNRHSVLKRRESTVIETPREGSVRPVSSSSSAIKKEVYGEVETRNRTELAKMVVTGMKACGLRDYRNNRGKSVVQAGEEDGDGGREREREKEREKEEYKQVYHHTVKAVAFAYVGFPFFLRVGIELTCAAEECHLFGKCGHRKDEGNGGATIGNVL